jgi:hypothetical protein
LHAYLVVPSAAMGVIGLFPRETDEGPADDLVLTGRDVPEVRPDGLPLLLLAGELDDGTSS